MTSQPSVAWPTVISDLIARQDLDAHRARDCMDALLSGATSGVHIAAFLVALRAKGERAEELSGLLAGVNSASVPVELPDSVASRAVDVVGTGGDHAASVNVSTMAGLVVAGTGVPVCKHGNRAASSQCGSADVLEALGVALEASPATVARCVVEHGFGFCFAPAFHPSFRHVGPVRRELGVPTAFNLLGPLANPARVRRLLVGVASPAAGELMAQTLALGGVDRAWVVHGPQGLDEITTAGISRCWMVEPGRVEVTELDPRSWGLVSAGREELVGGDPNANAATVRAVLDGARGPIRDVVLANAAAALVIAGDVPDMDAGIMRAAESVDSGRARAVLDAVIATSADDGRESLGSDEGLTR
jgi:anthranilate phosphoribosyltransferase